MLRRCPAPIKKGADAQDSASHVREMLSNVAREDSSDICAEDVQLLRPLGIQKAVRSGQEAREQEDEGQRRQTRSLLHGLFAEDGQEADDIQLYVGHPSGRPKEVPFGSRL